MTKSLVFILLLVAVTPSFSRASVYPGEAEGIAEAHLRSLGVLLPEVVARQSISAPVSGWLIDFLGYGGSVPTAFRVGVTDEGETNAGEVFVTIGYGADGTWFPGPDSSSEELLALEFLLDQRDEFMAVAAVSHTRGPVVIPPGRILTPDGEVDVTALLSSLHGSEVVFIGEQHDDPLAHQWELFIWKALATTETALALEMFETDVQPLLDQYLAGGVSRDAFLAGSRPWGNYEQDYEPLVEYAREHGFRVIAANVPRSFAAAVARGGFAAVSGEGFFQSLKVDSSNTDYRERFLQTMGAMGDAMHGMPMDHENMYRAQLLKDAVMAASIAETPCVFVCGRFHSDFFSGIVDQLPQGTRYRTVSVLGEGEPVDFSMAGILIVP
ncbi:MAG: ChaN family lipoprotein [Candidatus Fermentibacteraceae bacterium]